MSTPTLVDVCSRCGEIADEQRIIATTGEQTTLEWACTCGWRWTALVPSSVLVEEWLKTW